MTLFCFIDIWNDFFLVYQMYKVYWAQMGRNSTKAWGNALKLFMYQIYCISEKIVCTFKLFLKQFWHFYRSRQEHIKTWVSEWLLQFFSYVMSRTSFNCWDDEVRFVLDQHSSCLISGEATNTNFIVFGLIRSGLEPMIYHTQTSNLNLVHYLSYLNEISCYFIL